MFSLGLALFTRRVGGLRPGAEPGRARRRAPGAGAGRRAAQPSGAVDHRRRLHRPAIASARSASTASSSGCAAVGGQLIGGVLVQADIAGLGWRSCFLINVPIGLIAPGGRRARGARVARRGRPPPGPRGDRADHPRPRRHRPAARRGPPARLAGVDVAVPGRRADHARPLRRPPAAPEPPRRRAAARSRPVPRARVQRGPRDPARVLLEHGVVLPGARAVPAAGPRARRAAGRARVHDPGRRLPGGLRLRARA